MANDHRERSTKIIDRGMARVRSAPSDADGRAAMEAMNRDISGEFRMTIDQYNRRLRADAVTMRDELRIRVLWTNTSEDWAYDNPAAGDGFDRLAANIEAMAKKLPSR